ncbi:MAG TPA: hypothetical protein DCE42_10570 [Myxococcales bacterium]|nr:hypothetical protein [Myxococcales bacterium]
MIRGMYPGSRKMVRYLWCFGLLFFLACGDNNKADEKVEETKTERITESPQQEPKAEDAGETSQPDTPAVTDASTQEETTPDTSAPEPTVEKRVNVTPDEKVTPVHKNVTIQEAKTLIETDKDLVIIDVRTSSEFNGGHLYNAINIDYYGATFKGKMNALDKNKRYLVYCAVGGRSSSALGIMKELGFQIAYNLLGGFSAWKSAGYPFTK